MSKPTKVEVQEAMQFLVFTSPRNITEFAFLDPNLDVDEALKLYEEQHGWACDILERARKEGTDG